ncbi:MAG: hypothetical protein FWE34_04470 [Defluviitaleaceae bacterium]|nr:hypothetical protein [Defluviitaleaceae bacterium]
MAKRPRANSHDNTIRNIIIGFSVMILIVGGLLIWNNLDLNHAGTLDGERMPRAHLSFFFDQEWMNLIMGWGMPENEETHQWAMEFAFDRVAEMHLIHNQTERLGISSNDIDAEELDLIIQEVLESLYRPQINMTGQDVIRAMGFTNASFRRFIEMEMMNALVFDHYFDLATISEADAEAAFEQYLVDEAMELTQVTIRAIVTEDIETANAVMTLVNAGGTDFVDLMREYSAIPFDEDMIEVDIWESALSQDFNLVEIAYTMQIGEITPEPLSMIGGSWAIFEVVNIEDRFDADFVRDFFMGEYEEQMRVSYFREQVAEWEEVANIRRNPRIFGPVVTE